MKRFLGLHYRHDHYAKGFSPTWYMSLPFLQTCVPKLFPFRCDMDPRLFDLQLPDGDFVEIAHYEMPEKRQKTTLPSSSTRDRLRLFNNDHGAASPKAAKNWTLDAQQ